MNTSRKVNSGQASESEEPRPRRRVLQVAPIGSAPQRKQQFARNFHQLLKLVGLSRKEAAQEMGLSYKLVRRLVSAGVSRIDDSNKENLEKIVNYFVLPSANDLWAVNLIQFLLGDDHGAGFVAKFRTQLAELREQRLRSVQKTDPHELDILSEALGLEDQAEGYLTATYLEKTRTILSSNKSQQFMQLIDDYLELIATKPAA